MTPSNADRRGEVLLTIDDLSVGLRRHGGSELVSGVSLSVRRGETVGLVGESGSGKTLTGRSVMQLLPPALEIRSGSVSLLGEQLVGAPRTRLMALRGRQMSMIFQDAARSLNPAFTVGDQIAEVARRHLGLSRQASWERAVDMLARVGVKNARTRASNYPFQFSGGMCQRVMIAMALICEPSLLIADEPTTALDVSIQARVLGLVRSLQHEMDLGILFITHDFGVVAQMCDRVSVMYAGQIVEQSESVPLFEAPRHPYTEGLLAAIPRIDRRGQPLVAINGTVPPPSLWPSGCRFHSRCTYAVAECATTAVPLEVTGEGRSARCIRTHGSLVLQGYRNVSAADVLAVSEIDGVGAVVSGAVPEADRILEVANLEKSFVTSRLRFGRARAKLQAVDKVDIWLNRGETLAVVGESGAGKSTLGRMVIRLIEPDSGSVTMFGQDVRAFTRSQLRRKRDQMQMIFQDPYSSLDPKMTIAASVAEPLKLLQKLTKQRREARVIELLERVGVRLDQLDRYPHEMSGGQLQRVSIARALTSEPALIVCDEPVAALDVSIRAQVLNLFRDLQVERGLGYLFITHDLSLVQVVADRVAVMYMGRIVEEAPTPELFANPRHPYTRQLLSAVPVPDPRLRSRRPAEAATATEETSGSWDDSCAFAPRCPHAMSHCTALTPHLDAEGNVRVACFLYTDVADSDGSTTIVSNGHVPVDVNVRPSVAAGSAPAYDSEGS